MSIRNMNGDPAIWEACYWRDLSDEEKECWEILGWNEQVWDTQENVPTSASQVWLTLTGREQKAATRLGFTKEIWDAFEDQ